MLPFETHNSSSFGRTTDNGQQELISQLLIVQFHFRLVLELQLL